MARCVGLLASIACAAAMADEASGPAADGASVAGESAGITAVLDLRADGFLAGGLVPGRGDAAAPRPTVAWRSPLFAVPIEFDLAAIERIRFPKAAVAAPPASPWMVELRGGDFVLGDIRAIDADGVVLAAAGVGAEALRIRRSAIERISRAEMVGSVVVPGGLGGWNVPQGGWQEQAGRLVCGAADAAAYRDVSAPARACVDLVLSWDERPEFEAFYAAPGTLAAAAEDDRYRIELAAGDLLAIREGPQGATFDRVAALPGGAGRLHLQVFVDQERGRMAVVLPQRESAGAAVFDKTLAPRSPGHRKGFGIRLRTGSVRIDGLRVRAWKDPEPRFDTGKDLGGPGAVLESFDGSRGQFTFRGADGPRQMAAADVSAIEFPTNEAAGADPRDGLVMASFHAGTRLCGRIAEVTTKAIILDCPALADPLVCEAGQLAVIEPPTPRLPDPLPGRPGRLEADAGRMLGCLSNAAGADSGIAWLPWGAVAPVPIDARGTLRISYREIPGDLAARAAGLGVPGQVSPAVKEKGDAPGSAPAGQATVYLKTGDSITCTVISADAAGLRIRTDVAGETVLPAVAVRAVEFVTTVGSSIPKEKLARLLTLPRMQKADPPTHVLRLPNGDYLRGKLVWLDDRVVRMDILGVVQEIPRAQAVRLIWLSVEGDEAEARAVAKAMGEPARGSVPMRVTLTGGRILSLAVERMAGGRIVGKRGVLGTVSVDPALCDHLDIGDAALEARSETLPFSQWKLRPALLPVALRTADPAVGDKQPPAGGRVTDPLVGAPTVFPTLRLLEPTADGRTSLSVPLLEGRILVLWVFAAADAASRERLPRLAAALAEMAAEGVEFMGVAESASREDVAKALAGQAPSTGVAVDAAGKLHEVVGKPALPACVLVDREGRVADILPPAADENRVRARVAELVAGSRQTAREFQALARAHELVLAGDRGCLEPLGRLLDAASKAVRAKSIRQLRQLTGLGAKEMPFDADAPPEQRAEQALRWRQWLAKHGISAEVVFPRRLVAGWADGRPITGRTLVCRPPQQDVVELDERGEEVFKVPAATPWACDALPNGNRLIGSFEGRSIVEYDATGAEVWAVRDLPGGPMSVRRLDSGTTLVALTDANLVAEYGSQGKMVWSASVQGRPCDARRLPGGGTLVAAHRAGRIVEIDADGHEVWAVENLEDPQTAQRLPNGNTLLAMSEPGIVREIDPDGRVVWQQEGFRVPLDVQRLPNGRTLVQEQSGDLVEIDVDGSEVSRQATGGTRFLRF